MSVGGDDNGDQENDIPSGGGSVAEAARFISDMVLELSQIARRHRLDMLGYLLDMALVEAKEQARRSDD